MNGLKKFLLSVGVIIVFIAYSFQQRHDDTTAMVVPSSAKASTSQANTPTSTSSQSSNTTAPTIATSSTSSYKDGSYVGDAADAFYGNIQVKAIISGGEISDVQFIQYPNNRQNSVEINSQAMPYLKQEAIQAQTANVNTITGATDTSQAFVQSLSSALSKAEHG